METLSYQQRLKDVDWLTFPKMKAGIRGYKIAHQMRPQKRRIIKAEGYHDKRKKKSGRCCE